MSRFIRGNGHILSRIFSRVLARALSCVPSPARRRTFVLAAGLALAVALPAQAQRAFIVTDAATGEVLSQSNAHAYHAPASLTKMMVLYVVFEAVEKGELNLDRRLKVSRRAARQRPSRLGLRPGSTITARDAVLAMITKSANDAAVVVAEALSGSESKFARRMTLKARGMGMTRTTFRNATGLHRVGQLTTAYDMAILARALIRDFPQYYPLFATRTFAFKGRTYRNHNRLLGRYPGLDGIKTGYVRQSGYNVAVSAERDGRRVVAVFLGARSARGRDRYTAALLNKTFATLPAPEEPDGKETDRARKGGAGNGAQPAGRNRGARASAWAIQVGAYYRRALAVRAAKRAARRLPGWFGADQVSILPIAVKRGTVYRARVYGLTRARARAACRILLGKKLRCMTVSPKGVAVALAR